MAYDNPDVENPKPDAARPGGVRYVEAGDGDAGQRLDNFLVRVLKGVPRTHVYRLLRKGEVRVNSKRARPDQRLAPGDRVRLPPLRLPEPPSGGPRPASALLQKLVTDAIVYEDADLLVVNKPAGVAVHGGSGMSHGVIEALRSARPDSPELDLVHRLDRETSGCLIVAKKRSALRDLHAQLREGSTGWSRGLELCAGDDAARDFNPCGVRAVTVDRHQAVQPLAGDLRRGQCAHTITRLRVSDHNIPVLVLLNSSSQRVKNCGLAGFTTALALQHFT